MRIVVANAPLTLGPQFPIPTIIRDKGKDMPLGPLYLAAALGHAGYDDVHVFDVHTSGLGPEAAARRIIALAPDLLALKVYSFSWYDAVVLARAVRRALPRCHIAFGGPHADHYAAAMASVGVCDSVCVGYGEAAIVALARAVEGGTSLAGIPGLAYHDGSRVVSSAPAPLPHDLDSLPFPDRSRVRPQDYTSWMIDRPLATTAMMTSRGCPFACAFCSEARTRFKQRSVANVIAEMRDCYEHGYRMVNFEDDIMNLDRRWMLAFTDALASLPERPQWGFRGRVRGFDRTLAQACARAGCTRINFGVESGSDDIQAWIGKGITLADVREAVAAAKEAGITTVCYFILGFPGETPQMMRETYRFAREIAPDYAQFTPLVVMPGTRLYEREQELHGPGYDPFLDHTLAPTRRFLLPPPSGTASRAVVFRRARAAYFAYYFRPRFLFSGRAVRGGWRRGLRAGLSLVSYVLRGHRGVLERPVFAPTPATAVG